MDRRFALLGLGLVLAGCAADLGGDYLGGAGDPVRGAALNAPNSFGAFGQMQGRPADAALAAAQLEYLTQELQENPRYAAGVNPALTSALKLARDEMRGAVGIAPNAPARQVVVLLRQAALALQAGSAVRAEASLTGPAFPAGGAPTLARLGALPALPRCAEAASMAAQDFMNMGAGGNWRRR